MLLRLCVSQYIIHFPGSRRSFLRPLDAAQTVYFTIYYSLSRVWETLPETARCCSDRVFYNTLFTFPGLGGVPGDRSMLLRPCILQSITHFPGSRRSPQRPLDAAQTLYFTIYYSLPWVSEIPETARCCSDRVFYNILFTFSGLGGAPSSRISSYAGLAFSLTRLALEKHPPEYQKIGGAVCHFAYARHTNGGGARHIRQEPPAPTIEPPNLHKGKNVSGHFQVFSLLHSSLTSP